MPYSAPSDSPEASQTAVLALVRAEVASLRRQLLQSEEAAIDDSIARLGRALAGFEWAFKNRNPPAAMRPDLMALRGELAIVARLAQCGEALYRGLARLFGAAEEGYTPRGDGASLRPSASLSLRG